MNYTELKTAIQDYLENTETTFVSHLDTFIKQAENRIYNDVEFSALKKNQTATLTSGNKYLTVPDDYLSAHSLAVKNASDEYSFLIHKDVNFIGEAYPDSSSNTGLPVYYAEFDVDSFILGPTPDSGYTVELHYFYYPDSIVTASTSYVGDNFEMILLYACLIEAYTFMKGEPDLLELYTQRYADALRMVENFGHGKLRTDNYRTLQLRKPTE